MKSLKDIKQSKIMTAACGIFTAAILMMHYKVVSDEMIESIVPDSGRIVRFLLKLLYAIEDNFVLGILVALFCFLLYQYSFCLGKLKTHEGILGILMALTMLFGRAFEENNIEGIEKLFTSYLRKTISIRDTNIKKEMKENFYHGILLGLFAGMKNWKVKSNAESGEGYSDISVEIDDKDIGIVIELKYAEKAAFESACKEALEQIQSRNYEEILIDDGMSVIRKYGIACYKKRCKVISG